MLKKIKQNSNVQKPGKLCKNVTNINAKTYHAAILKIKDTSINNIQKGTTRKDTRNKLINSTFNIKSLTAIKLIDKIYTIICVCYQITASMY